MARLVAEGAKREKIEKKPTKKANADSADELSLRYRKFEDKSLDEQADEVLSDLIWKKESPLFKFDTQDEIERDDFVKDCIGCGIVFTLVTAIDLRVLNMMKFARNAGPLRKFVFLNALNTPFYAFYYNKLSSQH